MHENKYAIVADDAPNRCQGINARGQCRFAAVAVEGVTVGGPKYCAMHGGSAAKATLARQDQRKYRLAQWAERVNEFADDSAIKHLNEEVGILRMTLENVVLACQSPTDILLYSPKIGDLVVKIEKIVVSLHKIEASTGVLLTRNAAFSLASQIVDIVAKHVTDPDAVAEIADDIGKALANLKSEDSDL